MANITAFTTPPWLDTGGNAWQITAASLVGLQSVPGLVLYAGTIQRKWAVYSVFMAFYAFAATLICWWFGHIEWVSINIYRWCSWSHPRYWHVTSTSIAPSSQYQSQFPTFHHGLFPVRRRRHHHRPHCWCLSRSHELPRLYDIRPTMDHSLLHRFEHLGRWLPIPNGRHWARISSHFKRTLSLGRRRTLRPLVKEDPES